MYFSSCATASDIGDVMYSFQYVPEGLNDDKSALVQLMAWSRQTTSHYFNHSWMPFAVTRWKLVKQINHLSPIQYHRLLRNLDRKAHLFHTLILKILYLSLTLNMQGPSYLGLTRSKSWLLMPWLLVSPGHQQPWYWLCKIGRAWSYTRKDLHYLWLVSVEERHKM